MSSPFQVLKNTDAVHDHHAKQKIKLKSVTTQFCFILLLTSDVKQSRNTYWKISACLFVSHASARTA